MQSFINLGALVFELHLPQNVCGVQADTQTQMFPKNSQIEFKSYQNVLSIKILEKF